MSHSPTARLQELKRGIYGCLSARQPDASKAVSR